MDINEHTRATLRHAILEHQTELNKAKAEYKQKQETADEYKRLVDLWEGRIRALKTTLGETP